MSSPHHSPRHGYRNVRIAHAVAELFVTDLLPALEDPVLQDLRLVNVEVRSLACIHVWLGPQASAPSHEPHRIEYALSRVERRLRMELAESLRLKRMPMLRLKYLPWHPDARIGGEA
ncbi:MAG: hypothetical protein HS116_20760 [Planctomycetes bacterium]|nr:hypothetical protein [Planctomycetota bacterium]